MNLLLTGGAGFIGSEFVRRILMDTDYNIICLDRLDYSGNYNRIADAVGCFDLETLKRVKLVYHDLKAEFNPQLAKQIGPVDIIVHMAAGSHVDRSIEDPLSFAMDNVIGTVNILNFARTQDLKLFLYFSTDEVYGPAQPGQNFKEDSRYNATNPYSASKAGAEQMVVAFGNTYKIPFIITNTMNVFGPRQHPEKFVPMCVRKIKNGETVQIHATRDLMRSGTRFYISVEDVSDAVLWLIKRYFYEWKEMYFCPERFNIVGPEEISNLDLARFIADCLGKELKYEMVDFHSSRPGHDLRYALDGSRMKDYGWEPREIRGQLARTVRWFEENAEWI